MGYKHTYDTIYTHFQVITNNIYGFGRLFNPSFLYPSTTRPPHFYPSIFVLACPNDGWTGLYKAMIQAYRPVCATRQGKMYLLRYTDQCVPHNIWTCIYTGLQTSVYHTTGGHVSTQVYRSVCTTLQVDMYILRPTDQCVRHDRWTCIYTGLQTSVYHVIAVYVYKLAYRPVWTTQHM